ncbi:hypothetical protein BDY19DRAFT_237402 [Irpex rosettiformis]|uniref:Uncharacterized protein n=1 Tax=Irpex rosettiformis TaxID=378272 RepID=A0ACB8TZQ2_9APHY|nr:hypothetical protein BDY19DRAFT_237402 [Irpex rosettiformis]
MISTHHQYLRGRLPSDLVFEPLRIRSEILCRGRIYILDLRLRFGTKSRATPQPAREVLSGSTFESAYFPADYIMLLRTTLQTPVCRSTHPIHCRTLSSLALRNNFTTYAPPYFVPYSLCSLIRFITECTSLQLQITSLLSTSTTTPSPTVLHRLKGRLCPWAACPLHPTNGCANAQGQNVALTITSHAILNISGAVRVAAHWASVLSHDRRSTYVPWYANVSPILLLIHSNDSGTSGHLYCYLYGGMSFEYHPPCPYILFYSVPSSATLLPFRYSFSPQSARSSSIRELLHPFEFLGYAAHYVVFVGQRCIQ